MPDPSRLSFTLHRVRRPGFFSANPQRMVTLVFVGSLVLAFLVAGYFVARSPKREDDSASILRPDAPGKTPAPPAPILPAATLKPAPRPTAHEATNFESALVDQIHDLGYISITVHVALYEDGRNRRGGLGDGSRPDANMYWGSRYGVDVHLAKDAGWSRVFADGGDGAKVVRRSVFHRRVEPTEGWIARSVESPFDVYLLAQAWPQSRIVEAMEQPIRSALCRDEITIAVEGRDIGFGSSSAIVGYLGQNKMLSEYWDPFAVTQGCPPPERQMGVFYIAPRSAILLHRPVEEHGLYSVLFARETITPEAYLLSGMLDALIDGDLGDSFVDRAANAYTRYQKSIRESQAQFVLMR